MMMTDIRPGQLMEAEAAESLRVFCAAAGADHAAALASMRLRDKRALYTIARGSSDAAANILSYEFMRELGLPVTSLPPSVFSLGAGVRLADMAALVISQSGASEDLVRSAKGARDQGAAVLAITNQPDSAVEGVADVTLPINAGPERAVPATKSVIGAVAAGQAMLSAILPEYAARAPRATSVINTLGGCQHPRSAQLQAALLRARHVFVIGRDTGYGAAHETALKLKECCALHAEAYSSSEVLHGPLQLATNPLLVLILDTGAAHIQDSLNQAEARFRAVGCDVHRISPADVGVRGDLTPTAAAALLLYLIYPIVLNVALALRLNPDAPETLSKVTQTT